MIIIIIVLCIIIQAMIRVIPATGPVTVESNPVPWWVIFLPILAAVIIIGIIGGVLWGVSCSARSLPVDHIAACHVNNDQIRLSRSRAQDILK